MRPAVLVLVVLVACGDDADIEADAGPDAGPRADAGPDAGLPSGARVGEIRIGEYKNEIGAYAQVSLRFAGESPDFLDQVAEAGDCALFRYQPDFCDPACAYDESCQDGTCVPFRGEPVSVGTVSVTGVAEELEIEPGEDDFYYFQGNLPVDFFADDANVQVSATGDAWPAFSLTTPGVKAISSPAVVGGELVLEDSADRVITWTPGEPGGARVRLRVRSLTQGHGLPSTHEIRCEVADAAGQLTVAKSLIAQLPALANSPSCVGVDCPPSELVRYRESTTAVPAGHVALVVENTLQLWPVHEVSR